MSNAHRRSADMAGRRASEPFDAIVGANLKNHREARGMTLTEMGRHIGVTYQQIQRFERGANRITVVALWRASLALGVPINEFFNGLPSEAAAPPPRPSSRGEG